MRQLLPMILISLFLNCSSPDVAGSGSNAGNPYIVTVAMPSGEFADSAEIYIRKEEYLAEEATSTRTPDLRTDKNGNVEIQFADSGSYILEIVHGSRLAKQLNSEAIRAIQQRGTVITLDSSSTLIGTIERSVPVKEPILVQLRGFEQTVKVNEDGSFRFESVPPGYHRYRVKSADDQFTIDSNLVVTPNETLNMGEFKTPDRVILQQALEEMNITVASLEEVASFRSNGTIVVVDLEYRNISELSDKIGQLNLKSLKIGNNPIDKLPEWIKDMPRLESLFLSGCEFEELPDWIGSLHKLKTLAVAGNKLTSIPCSLVEIEEFSINVNGNRLHDLGHEAEEWIEKHSTDAEWKSTQLEEKKPD